MYVSMHEAANCRISLPKVQLDSNLLALLQEKLDGFNAHVQMLTVLRAGFPFLHCYFWGEGQKRRGQLQALASQQV